MENERYLVDATAGDWSETDGFRAQPRLDIRAVDETPGFADRFTDAGATAPNAAELDVTFRAHSHALEPGTTGVLAVSNNVTGAYLLECTTDAASINEFVRTVQRGAAATVGEPAYTLRLWSATRLLATYEKQVLLVYSPDGTLLRRQSLIPAGVEI